MVFEESEDEGQGFLHEEICDYEHDCLKSGSDMFTSGAQFGNPLTRCGVL